MPTPTNIKNLDILDILADSYNYCAKHLKAMSLFTIGHLAFLYVFEAMDKWESPFFLLWIIAYYVYGVFFYRFYLGKKPYLAIGSTAKSLVPSTKIVFITILLLSILMFLPFIPLFLTNNLELLDRYVQVLDAGIDKSKTFDLAANIIMIFISPIILYRPFMAWIASVMGRSPLLKTAFQKTRGNYWNFVFLSFLMNLPYMILSQIEFYFDVNNYLVWTIFTPLFVYFSVILGDCYQIFYLDSED